MCSLSISYFFLSFNGLKIWEAWSEQDADHNFLELFEELKQFLDLSKLEYLNIERRTSDQDCFIANISKAENILNWSPKISFREGLEKMIYWSREIMKKW